MGNWWLNSLVCFPEETSLTGVGEVQSKNHVMWHGYWGVPHPNAKDIGTYTCTLVAIRYPTTKIPRHQQLQFNLLLFFLFFNKNKGDRDPSMAAPQSSPQLAWRLLEPHSLGGGGWGGGILAIPVTAPQSSGPPGHPNPLDIVDHVQVVREDWSAVKRSRGTVA